MENKKKQIGKQFTNSCYKNIKNLQYDQDSLRYRLVANVKGPSILVCYYCGFELEPEEVYYCKDQNKFMCKDCTCKNHKPQLNSVKEDHYDHKVIVLQNFTGGEELYHNIYYDKN